LAEWHAAVVDVLSGHWVVSREWKGEMIADVYFWGDRTGQTIYHGRANVTYMGNGRYQVEGTEALIEDTDMERLGDFLRRMEET
jgi:hypothetical protein